MESARADRDRTMAATIREETARDKRTVRTITTVLAMAEMAVEEMETRDPETGRTEENVPTVHLTEESAPERTAVTTEDTTTVARTVRMEEATVRDRKADSPAREEEMTVARTTEEITEEETTEGRRTEEETHRLSRHRSFRNRSRSARRAKTTIRRKITVMTTEKTEFQKERNKNRCHSR